MNGNLTWSQLLKFFTFLVVFGTLTITWQSVRSQVDTLEENQVEIKTDLRENSDVITEQRIVAAETAVKLENIERLVRNQEQSMIAQTSTLMKILRKMGE